MIKLDVEDYCEECEDFLPSSDVIKLVDKNGNTISCDNYVRCKHRARCQSIYSQMVLGNRV